MDITGLKKDATKKIEDAETLADLEGVYRTLLGKKGVLTTSLKILPTLSPKERKAFGKRANEVKKVILEALEARENEIKRDMRLGEFREARIDITAPGFKFERGHLHPLTRSIREIRSIFASMGFEIASGPEIETEYYNFDALNIPPHHPARDLHDTFWLKSQNHAEVPRSSALGSALFRDKERSKREESVVHRRTTQKQKERLLLRTHTSPVQIRYMETHEPPFRIIAPGKCFRHEATDASHEFQFYQVEGLAVAEDISMAHLKGVLEEFFKRFFKKDVKTRFRPGYFPFVEPGIEVDITCITCGGTGCSVCGRSGWLEMLGAGMVHPNVFRAVGYNPREWQGFAFGVGIDRLTMMKYKIDDVRLFHSGDLRFIKQF